ncbi:MAG: efflux RND transporter permease subunit, partial [Dokdonella sp.]
MSDQNTPPRLGISGWLAKKFQDNPITPILAIAGLMLGIAAAIITPREEEPQIDVTMANVFVPFPGASARDVESLVSSPLETLLAEIEGVKHVYSISRPGMAVLTVEYTVGVERQPAIVRLYNQVFSNQDWMPPGVGVGQPLIRPMGVDDVPVMSVTLWTDDPARGATELAEVAHSLESELKRVPGTRDVYTIGAPERAVIVELDSSRLAAFNLASADVQQALLAANMVRQAGERITDNGNVPLTAGRYLANADDVANLVLGLKDGKPVQLRDIATISDGADLASSYVWHGAP